MKCPKCNTEMAPFEAEGVNLDLCDQCCGTWFDQGELAFYTETTEDVPDIDSAIGAGAATDSACPRCPDATLVETRFVPSSDLLIDICPSCRGIFLDKMELAKVETLSVDRDVLTKVGRAAKQLRDRGYLTL